MGKINYIKGDLFKSESNIIAHSVNCKGVFGSGIAGQIAKLYPFARMAYMNKFNKEGWNLSEIQIVPISNNKIIVNMATQDTYGRTGVHVDYDACLSAFKKLFRYAQMHMSTVSMPMVGSGLAGGSWEIIEDKIKEALKPFPELEINIYYL